MKRFESGEGTKGPLIYDNTGVDDYYFLNDPRELNQFITLINSIEDDWKSLYDCLEEKYLKVLNEANDKNREISRLKKELSIMKDKAYTEGSIAIVETSSDIDEDLDELRKEIYGEKEVGINDR